MAHSQSLKVPEAGWQWPRPTACPPRLSSIVSALDQTRDYIDRIVSGATEEDLWWRPEPTLNAMGNLLLHLAGTEHQWIGNKVGKATLKRDRDYEFSAKGGHTLADLRARLEGERLSTRELLAKMNDASVDEAVLFCFHYTENHFAYHCGELAMLRRLRTPLFRVYG